MTDYKDITNMRARNKVRLSEVFEAAYVAMIEAEGSMHNIAFDYWVGVDDVVEAARAGAVKARRAMMDDFRSKNG